MKVLSYCDGMSCGQIALNKLSIPVDDYFATEIKPSAIKVTKDNFPNTKYLGDLTLITEEDLKKLGSIDLFISGTPCKDFSQANKVRLGLNGEKSSLFFNFVEALNIVKPKYFFFENVKMGKEDMDTISESLGVQPVRVNSKVVSGSLRDRFYWTNIPFVGDLSDKNIKLQDVLESGWTDRDKARCLLESDSRPLSTPVKMFHRHYSTGFTTPIFLSEYHFKSCENHYNENFKGLSANEIVCNSNVYDGIRYLNRNEREKLQGVPMNYTKSVSENEAAGLLGDGWAVDVVVEFFRTYYGIMNEVTRVTEIENIKLGGGDAKAQSLTDKLNFAELGRFPEIFNLYNDYEKGYNTPYSVGFAIQLLKKKQFDFEREYFKL